MPYERFVMLLKSRSRTHHPRMHYSYTWGRRKNMPSIWIHPKMFYTYTRGKHKIMLDRFFYPPNKCSKFLLISLSKFCCRKETWGYATVIHKKREKKRKKRVEKNGQVSEISKTMGT
jgi:hypothetical protein